MWVGISGRLRGCWPQLVQIVAGHVSSLSSVTVGGPKTQPPASICAAYVLACITVENFQPASSCLLPSDWKEHVWHLCSHVRSWVAHMHTQHCKASRSSKAGTSADSDSSVGGAAASPDSWGHPSSISVLLSSGWMLLAACDAMPDLQGSRELNVSLNLPALSDLTIAVCGSSLDAQGDLLGRSPDSSWQLWRAALMNSHAMAQAVKVGTVGR